jgi:hypothetical protein
VPGRRAHLLASRGRAAVSLRARLTPNFELRH